MSQQANDGGSAFPVTGLKWMKLRDGAGYERDIQVEGLHGGMSLRDYFAAKAMQGFVSGVADGWEFEPPQPISIVSATDMALSSYRIADAMLRAREGKAA